VSFAGQYELKRIPEPITFAQRHRGQTMPNVTDGTFDGVDLMRCRVFIGERHDTHDVQAMTMQPLAKCL
jgi:hypothetical protein